MPKNRRCLLRYMDIARCIDVGSQKPQKWLPGAVLAVSLANQVCFGLGASRIFSHILQLDPVQLGISF